MDFQLSPADKVCWILAAVFFGIGAVAPLDPPRLSSLNWMLLAFFCIALSVLI